MKQLEMSTKNKVCSTIMLYAFALYILVCNGVQISLLTFLYVAIQIFIFMLVLGIIQGMSDA